MPFFIKIKINHKEEIYISQDDILGFHITYNNNLAVDTFRLEINNVEKYIKVFEKKIDFFKTDIIVNGTLYDIDIFYPTKIEIQGSRIILNCTSIKLSNLEKTYNIVFEKQSLKSILSIIAGEIELDGLILHNTLEKTVISKFKQNNVTNLDILKILCEIFYSYTTVQCEKLVFLKKCDFHNDDFSLAVMDNMIISINEKESEYKIYNGIKCSWYNTPSQKKENISIGEKPYLTIESRYNQELTELLLNSKYKQIKEKELIALKINHQLILGIEMFIKIPDNTIQYQAFKGTYCTQEVQHKYDGHNIVTHIVAYKIN